LNRKELRLQNLDLSCYWYLLNVEQINEWIHASLAHGKHAVGLQEFVFLFNRQ